MKSLSFGSDSETICQTILSDLSLTSFYKQLACACYDLVEVLGFPGSSAVAADPGHVHKVYTGDALWSMYVNWLEKEAELKSLILKAYRHDALSCKQRIDNFIFLCSVIKRSRISFIFIGGTSRTCWPVLQDFFVRKLRKLLLTKLAQSRYSYIIDIIFVKLFSFFSEPANCMYVLCAHKQERETSSIHLREISAFFSSCRLDRRLN